MPKPEVRHILCDLGKTLVNFDHRIAATRLYHFLDELCEGTESSPPPTEQLHEFLFGGENARNLVIERGRADLPWLAEEFEKVYGFAIPLEKVRAFWCEIFTDENEEVFAAMKRAEARSIPVSVCSNTSRAHWDYVLHMYPRVGDMEGTPFLSFRMGKMKTDPGFFAEIADALAMPGENLLFIDDLQENLDAAASVGIQTIHYQGRLGKHRAWAD